MVEEYLHGCLGGHREVDEVSFVLQFVVVEEGPSSTLAGFHRFPM